MLELHGKALELNLKDESRLGELIDGCDLAVSLVPPDFHTLVARMCIERRKPMVTTSYVSNEMQALDGPAREAGVVVLNEIGVDPGIDHMSAMETLDGLRDRGARITAFETFTGGLVVTKNLTIRAASGRPILDGSTSNNAVKVRAGVTATLEGVEVGLGAGVSLMSKSAAPCLGSVNTTPAATAMPESARAQEAAWESYASEHYTLAPRESFQLRIVYEQIPVRAWQLVVDGGDMNCDLTVLRVAPLPSAFIT